MPSDLEKLQVLLPHWIEHNTEHAAEFRRWAAQAGIAAADIVAAAEGLETASYRLRQAQDKLGGPLATRHAHGG